MYINYDGSHDNVNYTCVYMFIHFLLCAEKSGWPLKKFVILRLPVGHTHVLLDAAWGLLAQFIYGILSRGDARLDILDWNQLEKACHTVYQKRLKVFEHIQGCFDFDEFVSSYRAPSVDTGIYIVIIPFDVVISHMTHSPPPHTHTHNRFIKTLRN